MKFKIDENLPVEVANLLEENSYDAVTVLQQNWGLIVLRLKKQNKPYVLSVIDRLIKILTKEPLEHHLWIVEEERIRISG